MALEATVLPELTPVLVATRREVDLVVKDGRAEVARLALELKSTLHEVAELERLVDEPGPPDSPELLLAAIEAQKRAQRQTFPETVERVTAEAAATVAAARSEADALIAAASAASTDVLRRALQSALPPSVRIHGADVATAPAPLSASFAPPPVSIAAPSFPVTFAAPTFAAPPPAPPPPPPVTSTATGAATADSKTVSGIRHAGIRSLLYADVLIPVIGAVIILVILLAWIG